MDSANKFYKEVKLGKVKWIFRLCDFPINFENDLFLHLAQDE